MDRFPIPDAVYTIPAGAVFREARCSDGRVVYRGKLLHGQAAEGYCLDPRAEMFSGAKVRVVRIDTREREVRQAR